MKLAARIPLRLLPLPPRSSKLLHQAPATHEVIIAVAEAAGEDNKHEVAPIHRLHLHLHQPR